MARCVPTRKPGGRGAARLPKLAIAAFLPAISLAQSPPGTDQTEIVTDRPDVTEASTVVPKGSVQFENGLTYTAGHGSGTLDLAETLMRVGSSAGRRSGW